MTKTHLVGFSPASSTLVKDPETPPPKSHVITPVSMFVTAVTESRSTVVAPTMPMPISQTEEPPGIETAKVTVNVTSSDGDGPGAKTFGVMTGDVSNAKAGDDTEIVPAMAIMAVIVATVQLLRM